MTKTIESIISAGLDAFEYGGLYIPGVCGCRVGDISPKSCLTKYCQPGFLHARLDNPDHFVISEHEIMSDDEIRSCTQSPSGVIRDDY